MTTYNFPGGPRRKRRIRRAMLQVWPWCCWCGKKLDEATATIEHIIPHAKGGGHGKGSLPKCPYRRHNSAVASLAGAGGKAAVRPAGHERSAGRA